VKKEEKLFVNMQKRKCYSDDDDDEIENAYE